MKISVVMPVFNQARFIMRAVESVWAQDVLDVEIIIVDDCSIDETQAVLCSLSGKENVRCITHEENKGPAAARNHAIRESRGEWIAFLDGDDYWLQGKLKAQLRALAESDADFAYCGSVVVDDENRRVSTHPAVSPDALLSGLMWGNLLSTPTVIVRRSLLDRTGLFDEVLRTGEDWDLWLRLAMHGRGVCVAEPLVAVHHGESNARSYSLSLHEVAIPRIFSRFFESLRGREDLAEVASQRRKVLSCHFSMLAKAHFRERHLLRSFRYAVRSITSSPQGFRYLLPGSINAHQSQT
jgi:glycosyltransferase involved in cell wall biosynthesis